MQESRKPKLPIRVRAKQSRLFSSLHPTATEKLRAAGPSRPPVDSRSGRSPPTLVQINKPQRLSHCPSPAEDWLSITRLPRAHAADICLGNHPHAAQSRSGTHMPPSLQAEALVCPLKVPPRSAFLPLESFLRMEDEHCVIGAI
ncbi:hypothetical protein CVT26_005600 [Gymnopilus dilepis]|uniref:Uncharacterized protein n=1 Tax=Gymnopilus dilepis TaxID=231916 RepID=A0A409XZR4_9AGAR|nr:hypothetical protein CVT26_005600 [Gymnopilus dilepis]